MKQGKPVITLAILAIAAALAVYLGVYAFQTFHVPFSTTLAYQYTVNDSAEASGLLVREELVLPNQAGILDVTRAEAEKVGAGQTVALIYRDNQTQANQAELDQLAVEIELLEYAVSQSGDVESAARLDEDILQAVVALRASSALGDYNELEDQVMDVKSSVLKRGYTYGDGLTAQDLTAQLRQLKSRQTQLQQQTASAITRVTAKHAGTFSNLVDGYETTLTPDTVFHLTPTTLDSLMDGSPGSTEGLGKLIFGNRWYFASSLPAETAKRLREGEWALLRFTGDFSQDVEMRIDQIGPKEGDRTLVVFSSDRYLSRTTLLRQQRAELIFEDFTGLRVPKQALRMVKDSQEDEETGAVTEMSRLGVYVLISGRAEFKEVEVIKEGSDYYVVRSLQTGRKILRAGDEVITQATGLFDGQLLEY